MPQIELTVPRGALSDAATDELMAELTTTLLRWEGAPTDSPGAKELSWGYVHEVAPERTYHGGANAAGGAPRYRVDVTVPEGALDDERKNGLVGDVTKLVLAAEGTDDAAAGMRVWVIVREVPDGNWGGAGRTWRLREIAKFVAAGEPREAPAEAALSGS
jgi:phenylpyruvate tautomerase PptA (4-oxalocrotonate tautomerase family)